MLEPLKTVSWEKGIVEMKSLLWKIGSPKVSDTLFKDHCRIICPVSGFSRNCALAKKEKRIGVNVMFKASRRGVAKADL